MTTHRGMWMIFAGLLLLALICAIVWADSSPAEPSHAGKKLSLWLEDLAKLDYAKHADRSLPEVQAVRAIGTNAIPWLLYELRGRGTLWMRFKLFLAKKGIIQYRGFADAQLRRATIGFRALGELGEPAIPALLDLVESKPGYVPGALAGIGLPAVPALQQCLANTKLYTNSLGTYAIIPGNTIAEIHNATSLRVFSKSNITIFLPAIQAWAKQSTNQQAARKAGSFLEHFDQLE